MTSRIYKKILLIVILFGLPLGFFFYYYFNQPLMRPLPKLGSKSYDTTRENGEVHIDTQYHTLPDYQLTDQVGTHFSTSDLKGNIHVADFIYTRDQNLSDQFSGHFANLQNKFKKEEQLKLVSYTVDPTHDSARALKKYAARFDADPSKWHFLTGPKDTIFNLARNGYFVTLSGGEGQTSDIIHTRKFVLVDQQGIIRGYYNGTDSSEVEMLMQDIINLISQAEIKKELSNREITVRDE